MMDAPSCSCHTEPWGTASRGFFASVEAQCGGDGISPCMIPAGTSCARQISPCGTGWRGLLGCSQGCLIWGEVAAALLLACCLLAACFLPTALPGAYFSSVRGVMG